MSYPSPYPIPRRIALSVGLLLVRWARRPAGPDSLTVDRSTATSATAATTARSARPAVVTARAAAVVTADRGAPAVATTDRGAPAAVATPAVDTADHTVPGAGQARATAPVTDAVSPNPAQHARAVADRERAIRQFEVDRQVAAERTRAEHRALSWPGHP